MLRTAPALLLLTLLLTTNGCSQPGPPQAGGTEPPPRVEPAATPVDQTPRLLLDLALGDEPGQPGRSPFRVGGVSPRGPLAIAVVDATTLYLLDQAKGRVLRYENGQVTGSLAIPWAHDQVGSLDLVPGRLVVTSLFQAYTLDLTGRIRDIRSLPYRNDPLHDTKEPVLLGEDPDGNRYERVVSPSLHIRRVSKEGDVLATAPDPGGAVDWYISRDGGLYALTWEWGHDQIDRARVHEVLPPVSAHRASELVRPPLPAEEPELFGRPVPDRIRLAWPSGPPVEVSSPVDRWNLWRLLATAGPATAPLPAGMQPLTRLEATFADDSTLQLDLYPDQVAVQGARYTIGAADALRLALGAARVSPGALTAAVSEAQQVSVAILDLPGVERTLSAAERQRLVESLKSAAPVQMYAMPQPLEQPFPRYAISLEGDGWEGELALRGERHLSLGYGAAAAHDGTVARLVTGWLPLPELQRDEVSYLFLADRLEIGAGSDLTRWKNTVVRHLLGLSQWSDPSITFREPLTFTFHVQGERLTVQVDPEGFTYGGERYAVPGLTDLAPLQGVP